MEQAARLWCRPVDRDRRGDAGRSRGHQRRNKDERHCEEVSEVGCSGGSEGHAGPAWDGKARAQNPDI
mgnify:CR=1 FL=1